MASESGDAGAGLRLVLGAFGVVIACGGLFAAPGSVAEARAQDGPFGPVLDKREVLERQSWWDNRDWGWYERNIPFLETPETVIDATYYYRWEVMTKHLVYGSPGTGYTFTEFMDRPGWSGAFGSISCPLGHQFYEVRWLKDRRVIHDFANYWFESPGAEPRSYSNWYGDSMWAIYQVWQDPDFVAMVYPHMQQQYHGWMAERWDAGHGMFLWDGMHDGMETNINSRQTEDTFSGGDGYRPTLNSYLYADLRALSRAAALLGEEEASRDWAERAERLKQRVQDELWDPARQFFFHQWAADQRDGIEAKTLTHQTGRFAGSAHGRELIGYVPWQFNLPDPQYSVAWQYLMDDDYFWSDYGPTVTEQGDPLFYVSPRCCVWSGNSWPYATTQTLVAMANLLNDYDQAHVDRADWFELLRTYSRLQRKAGRPYVAEAANPFTGSWEGHDHYYHSEHYLHSGYVDLVITGLAGLRPRADDTIEVNPLIPDHWDYFALEDVAYHGHSVSILWDRTGERYGRGQGLMLFVDGARVDSAGGVQRLVAGMPPAPSYEAPVREHNVAVNNATTYYPHLSASSSHPLHPPFHAVDGSYWYHETPANRWVSGRRTSAGREEWLVLDFGTPRAIHRIEPYFLDDDRGVEAPARFELEFWDGGEWAAIPGQERALEAPVGHRPNTVTFPELSTSKVRLVMTPRAGAAVGLTELEAWSSAPLPLDEPTASVPNLAYDDGEGEGEGEYPRWSASYTYENDRLSAINDMKPLLHAESGGRWTAYESPNDSDWVAVDFGEPHRVARLDLYLYGDDGGIRAPAAYSIEYWTDGRWQRVQRRRTIPEAPTAMALNTVVIEPVETSRVRVRFEHALPAYTGVTELMIWSSETVE